MDGTLITDSDVFAVAAAAEVSKMGFESDAAADEAATAEFG
jgi:hypothetical protein